MRGGPNKGALAALGIAGLIWAYKNRDKLSSKFNDLRNQLPNTTGGQSHERSYTDQPYESQSDMPGQTRLGDNYNTTI